MKIKILISACYFLFCFFSFSQNPIEISYSQDSRGFYIFKCENHDYCNYTVTVDFAEISNLRANTMLPFTTVVKPGMNDLLELRPVTDNHLTAFKLSYSYMKGCINPDVNLDYIYLLPIGKGKETQIFGFEYLSINAKDPEPKNWYAAGFKMAWRDTVFAARRGTVTSMRDTTILKLSDYGYSSDDNYIEIAHDDCSFGMYEVLSGVLVRLGQRVEAGEPIGLAGGEKYVMGSHIRLSVKYSIEEQVLLNDNTTVKRYWAFIPMIFCTRENKHTRLSAGNKYTCIKPDSVVTQEMSKQQLKKWGKNKNKSNPAVVKLNTRAPAVLVNEYAAIDERALQLPDSLTRTTDAIARYITSNFTTDMDKARAIFIWIAANIQYDIDNMFALNFYEQKEEKISKPLKTRKGICENYAALFNDICLKSGIKSIVIEGYTKQNGFTDYIPHAWCAASIDSSWFLFDPTWGSGYVSGGRFYQKINNNFFKTDPVSFISSHMPFDFLWQFLYYPVTNQEFYEGNTQQNKSKPFFNYIDSIGAFEKQTNIEQLISTAGRIERNGIKNSMIFDRLQHIKFEIDNDRQNKTVMRYNEAVIDFNDGLNNYNIFIQYRNKQFIPRKSDSEIKNMMDASAKKLLDAKTKLGEIQNPDATALIMVKQLTKSIDHALLQVAEQQSWLKKYFSKAKPERKWMFYENVP